MKSYFRPEIDALAGYVAGEQPKIPDLIKLNTNENPFPPSPQVAEVLRNFDIARLRRYPDPFADELRDAFAAACNLKRENIIAGNGSDDLLTMIFRAFTDNNRPVAVFDPSYSLYPVLAAMQGAPVIKVPLTGENFDYPDAASTLQQCKNANLLVITRPNAPTGNLAAKTWVETVCAGFDGIVLIDEAYADFADDNCMELAGKYDNVLVMRTFSKSLSMAGVRLGFAAGNPVLIEGLMKLKDSYNLDMLSQAVALANYNDREYQRKCLDIILAERQKLSAALGGLGFHVVPSQANFLFASPADGDGEACFKYLREAAIIVRYFKGERTGKFVRITIGTPEENAKLVAVLSKKYSGA